MWQYNHTTSDNELYHYGIKGMKWGVRRSQTELGNAPAGGSARDNKKKKGKSKVEYVNEAVKSTGELQKVTSKDRDAKRNKQAKETAMKELSKMSDDELRAVVNRLNMEERYSQVMSSRYADAGKNRVDSILDKVGTAVTVTSSILSIALAVKELSK